MKGDGRCGYLRDGTYMVQITSVEKGTRHRDSKTFISIEFRVLESTNPEVRPGETCIHTVLLGERRALGELGRIATACGYDLEGMSVAKALKALQGDAADGSAPRVRVKAKRDPKANRPFTRLTWS